MKEIQLSEVLPLIKQNEAVILDERPANAFILGFIPGSIFIHHPALVNMLNLKNLTTIGYYPQTKAMYHFANGFNEWVAAGNEVDMMIEIEPDELAMDIPFEKNMVIVDVRNATLYGNGHVKNAMNFPPEDFNDLARLASFEDHEILYLYDNGDGLAITLASLLKRHGMHNLRVITSGYATLASTKGIETEKEPASLN